MSADDTASTEQIMADLQAAMDAARAACGEGPAGPVELLPAGVGSGDPQWHEVRRQGIGASEVAAVLGLSPWQSAFSLWWAKREGWTTETTEDMSTGTRLEPAIADWWADQHEDLVVLRAGLYAHPDRPWQLASPDRLVHATCSCCGSARGCTCSPAWTGCADCLNTGIGSPPHAVLECKWTGRWDGWGDEGTDQIPVYYRTQVLWQCDVMGLNEWHLAALGPSGFRAYQGRRDEQDLVLMRETARRFIASLDAGEQPDVDDHPATIAALKALHPSVEDHDIDADAEFAAGYQRARAMRDRANALVGRYEARARQALGDGRRLVCDGRPVVTRSVYDQQRLDTKALRANHPDIATKYTTTTTVDKLITPRAKKEQ